MTPDHDDNGPGPARGRGGDGRFEQTVDGAERDARATRLRARGRTYQQISDELGYGGRGNAERAVKRVIAGIEDPAREEARRELVGQLDELAAEAWAVLERHHYVVSDGRIVRDGQGQDAAPLLDDGPVLQAIDRLVRIADRRSKLLGLDAPAKLEVAPLSDLDAAVIELERELRLAAGGSEVPVE